jgi:hypothetical protein
LARFLFVFPKAPNELYGTKTNLSVIAIIHPVLILLFGKRGFEKMSSSTRPGGVVSNAASTASSQAALLRFAKLSAIVDVQTSKVSESTLESMKHWHYLMTAAFGVAVLEIGSVYFHAKQRYGGFIKSYDAAIAMGRTENTAQLQSLPSSASGLNIALSVLYPIYGNVIFGPKLPYAEACIAAFYSAKFGKCMNSTPQVAASYYATMWEKMVEGNAAGGGTVNVRQDLCATFYKCDKVDCAPSCGPSTVASDWTALGVPALQGAMSMGMNGSFLGHAAGMALKVSGGGPMGLGLLIGAGVGAALSYAAASSQHNANISSCEYNTKYTQCWAPPEERLCGAKLTCGQQNLPACTETTCLTEVGASPVCGGVPNMCSSAYFIIPSASASQGALIGCPTLGT